MFHLYSFKFAQNKCPTYMNKVFRPAENIRINTRNSYLKLKHPNWLYKTILRLSHLSKAELLLFSTRSFSKLYFLFSLMWHFKHILALPVHPTKLLSYTTKKPVNQLILEIKLSSKGFSGNNFIVLFKLVLPCFINQFSLRSSLNLLESVAKMLKSSKFIVQLHCKRWSNIAGCLTFFRCFPVRLDIPMCSIDQV